MGPEHEPGVASDGPFQNVLSSATSICWEATLQPFASELPAACDWVSSDGVTVEGGVRTFSLDDAASARAMSESASRAVALASPGKVGLAARARVIGWDRVDVLVAASLPMEFARGVTQHGVEVVQAA